ncbi:MAG: DUF4249 family protein, partial [Bacteroidota bacterium]
MNRILIFWSLLLSSTLFFSCETDVTEDVVLNGAEPRLIVEGGIERNLVSPLAEQQIRLTTTIGFLDEGTPNPVPDAIVIINDGTTDFQFTHEANGIYANQLLEPRVNTTYTLRIEWNNELYEATDRLNEVATIERIYSEFEEATLVTDEGYFVKYDSRDPAGVDNFYYYKVFRNGE